MIKKTKWILPLIAAIPFLSNMAFAGSVERKAANPWMIYLGGFSGYYSANFAHGGNYFVVNDNLVFGNTVVQTGVLGGVQLGFQYHLQTPYFFGLSLSEMSNANKARMAEHVDNEVAGDNFPFNINHEFRVQNNLDIAGIIGTDITSQTHAYLKFGASCGTFKHKVFTTQARQNPFPIPVFQQTQRKDLWGLLLGFGLTHDLNRWLNAFVEYDYYDYGTHNLNSLNNISPTLPANQVDRFTQHATVTANAFRVGLNLKFMGNPVSATHHFMVTKPWLVYLGILGGYYDAGFGYGGNYFSTQLGSGNQVLNDYVLQQGYSLGAKLGFNYHFQSPYYAGLMFSIMTNANKGRLDDIIDNLIAPLPINASFGINSEFKLRDTLDIAGIIGADITPQTHIYLKVGASYSSFKHKLFTTLARFAPFPIPSFQQAQTKNLWGWVLGFGLTRDLSRWINAFVEYDYYDYGKTHLNALDNIAPNIPGNQIDHLTQHVKITAHAFLTGLNFKLMDRAFSTPHRIVIANPWLIYLGVLGGYYGANFGYGANYFTAVDGSNQILNDYAAQKGYSVGGQFGFDYHFQNPYYVGFAFSIMSNANKARLTNLLEDTVPITNATVNLSHEFRVKYNLDISGVVGTDITAQTRIYLKVGASYASFKHKLFTTRAGFTPFPILAFQNTQTKGLWGWLLGVGLTHDLSRWINAFVEYDHYDYGKPNLNSVNNILPIVSPSAPDRLTQHIAITANSVRAGLNLKIKI